MRYSVFLCLGVSLLVGTTVAVAHAQNGPVQEPSICQWIAPETTDENIDIALEPHYVCHDASAEPLQRLLVFFPGTGATPDDYELFVETGAAQGLHAIGLSFPNPRSINLQVCPRDPDPNCHANAREEVITGVDLHAGVDVNAANAITNRLVRLLEYLHATQPEVGWDIYLNGDSPRWESIVVAGHSQGGGMAAYVAHQQPVARAITFGWVDLVRRVAAPWITEPHATPGERIYTFEHVDDRTRGESAKEQMFRAFGLDVTNEVNVDDSALPYNGSHILLTSLDAAQTGARPSAGAHNMPVADDFTPIGSAVGPVLEDVWAYLLVHDLE